MFVENHAFMILSTHVLLKVDMCYWWYFMMGYIYHGISFSHPHPLSLSVWLFYRPCGFLDCPKLGTAGHVKSSFSIILGMFSCVCLYWHSCCFVSQSLLDEPNPASPANNVAANLYKENRREYEKRVKVIVEESWIYHGEVEWTLSMLILQKSYLLIGYFKWLGTGYMYLHL